MRDDLQNKCLYCMNGAYDAHTKMCPVCHTVQGFSNQDHQLMAGSLLGGRYLVGRVLGQGGFGITYIGWDIGANCKVAIKEYFPNGYATRKKDNYTLTSYTDEVSQNTYRFGMERFITEAERLKNLGAVPNVVRVQSSFCENGTAYIVMDFIEGITLKKYIADQGGVLTMADVMEKLHPIITALSTIHGQNMIHRDISPDNIVLSPMGAVLLDFGSARGFSVGNDKTKTINVKMGYAPLEQYDTHGNQGPWTDVYALASTIYRAVTGVLPASALDRSGSPESFRLPRTLNPQINKAEEQVILRGMAMDPAYRYRDVAQFYADLLCAHHGTGSGKPSTIKEPKPPKNKYSVPSMVLGIVLALLLVGTTLWMSLYAVYGSFFDEVVISSLVIATLYAAAAVCLVIALIKKKSSALHLSLLALDMAFVGSLLTVLCLSASFGFHRYFLWIVEDLQMYIQIAVVVLAHLYTKSMHGVLFTKFKELKRK